MTDISEQERVTKARAEVRRYVELFRTAFNELHDAVIKQVNKPGQYISPHHSYPIMSMMDSGFPAFREVGFDGERAPKDYTGIFRPRGLLGIFGGFQQPQASFPAGAELASFLRSHDIGRRLNLGALSSDRLVDGLVADAVERYLHLYNLTSPIDAERRDAIIRPPVFGTIFQNLKLRLVVPITMTHFEAILANQSEAMRLSLSRLNGCLTRDDAADAILDGTIGLELLLGDDQSQSLSYKLRLRAAALALLHGDPAYSAAEVASKVKRLYEARSAIVHGRRKKSSKKASEPAEFFHSEERLLASDLLRFVLNVLLMSPEYQDPARIDAGLLLRGDEVSTQSSVRRTKKKKKH